MSKIAADFTPTDLHEQTGSDFGSDPNLLSGTDYIFTHTGETIAYRYLIPVQFNPQFSGSENDKKVCKQAKLKPKQEQNKTKQNKTIM